MVTFFCVGRVAPLLHLHILQRTEVQQRSAAGVDEDAFQVAPSCRQQFGNGHVRLLVECEGWRKILFFMASRKKRKCKQNYNGKEQCFFHRMIFKDWNCKNSTFFAILHFSISAPF